jgi:hypothetical protein
LKNQLNLLNFYIIFLLNMCLFSAHINAEDLLFRNPYNINSYVESEHFAVLWGEGLTESDVQSLLDLYEKNWDFIIEEKKFERPKTTNKYKENIYISGTGQPLLDDEPAAIQGLDKEGHEHIIMHKNLLKDQQFLHTIVAHEFFHSIQNTYNIPELSPRLWLGEATASWVMFMSFPDDIAHLAKNILAQYAFYPQYSLDVVITQSTQYLLGGHHYGSYIFFQHLIDYFNDEDLIIKLFNYVKSEVANRENKLTLVILNDFLLLTYGEPLRPVFHKFAERNAIWDYPEKNIYLEALNIKQQNYTNEHTAELITSVPNSWKIPSSKFFPHRWGTSYIKLTNLTSDTLDIGFEGNALGNEASTANWQASIVGVLNGTPKYIELILNDNKINNFRLSSLEADEVWLAISVSSEGNRYDEVFAYRYQFAEVNSSEPSPQHAIAYEPTIKPIPTKLNPSSGGSVWLLLWFCCLMNLFRSDPKSRT